MIAKLTKELVDALGASGESVLEVVDPDTNQTYVIVDSEIHRRAMEALRRQQDRDAIAQGIAEMEAGEGTTLEEAFDDIRFGSRITATTGVKYRLVILPQAKADVLRNAEWWARHHSLEQAATWLDTIQAQLESIATFPESHSLSAEDDEFSYEIRDKLLGLGTRPAYRAVYTIRGDTVYVLTVRRAAQDAVRPDEVQPPPAP